MLRVDRLSNDATVPTKAHVGSAGFDLYSAQDIHVPARGRMLVFTDIIIALPDNTYGRIAPRSGLAWKSGIDVGAGVLDSDYRGNVAVLLFNHTDEDFVVRKKDRIAQLLVIPLAPCTSVTEDPLIRIDKTTRGFAGFGSTGK